MTGRDFFQMWITWQNGGSCGTIYDAMNESLGELLRANGISPLFLLIYLWTLPWKGVALWKAAGKKHLGWFIALLLVNSAALMEALYIFYFSKKSGKKEKQPVAS